MALNVKNLLHEARMLLLDAGTGSRLDAEVLLGHALERPRSFLRARPEFHPGPDAIARFGAMLNRRRAGEPLAYILGEREFWSLPLKLNRHTLIPRPETELLVEQALARIPETAAWTIADLGTGSGAIALAVASERPGCRVIATDVSPRALAIARANTVMLGLDNVELRRGSWLAALSEVRCELIVANPPYIAAGDAHLSQPELGFEPRAALVAGPTGLEALEAIIADAPAYLAAGGSLLLEHGFDQRAGVAAALAGARYRDIHCYQDIVGHDRLTAALAPATEVSA